MWTVRPFGSCDPERLESRADDRFHLYQAIRALAHTNPQDARRPFPRERTEPFPTHDKGGLVDRLAQGRDHVLTLSIVDFADEPERQMQPILGNPREPRTRSDGCRPLFQPVDERPGVFLHSIAELDGREEPHGCSSMRRTMSSPACDA
jgi:hypothetical protein